MYVVCNNDGSVTGIQTEKAVGLTFTANGKFFLPTPPGVSVGDVTYGILPEDVVSGFETAFLSRYSNYVNVLSNYFLDAYSNSLLDSSSSAPTPVTSNVATGTPPTAEGSPQGPRFQVGTGPNQVAILSKNTHKTTANYGSVITEAVDLTPFNPSLPGTDEVLVWWKVVRNQVSEDVQHGYSVTASLNNPSMKSFQEVDPEDILVYASADDGVTWDQVTYMKPCKLSVTGTDLRIAFINEGLTKVHLLAYAVLFPNL